LSLAVVVFLAHSTLCEGEEQEPTAGIIGLHMMQGDDPLWRESNFDSGHWPYSKHVANSSFNRILIPEGIGWLRTEPFGLPDYFTTHPVALYVISGASFQVFWNGNLIGENGRPATSMAEEIDGMADTRFYIPPRLIQATGNVLAIRYSALGYSRLHLPLAISLDIGAYKDQRYNRLASHVPALLLLGAVGVAALFFASLYLRRRFDKGSLWLALMFLMVTLQSASEISRALYSFSYFGIVTRILLVAILAYGSGLFLNFFILSYLRLPGVRRWALGLAHAAVLVAILFHFNHFDKLTYAFIAIFAFSALFMTSYGAWIKRPGARPLLMALIVFCFSFLAGYTAFLDIYYYASMALLAGTLFVLQANAIRQIEGLAAEEKLRSKRLELDLLKRQIQPHFIMNTLTALSEWILTNPQSGVEMINALADEFRILNEYSDKQLVPLESELKLCRSHLTLMSYRQDQTFLLTTDLQNTGLSVPPAIFHTLIENALTHSRYSADNTVFDFKQTMTEAGEILFSLTAPAGIKRRRNGNDSGGGGLGLSYVKSRLQESWGDAFVLDFGEDESGRWRTTILIKTKVIN